LPDPTIVTFLRMNGPFLKSLTTEERNSFVYRSLP
jgi:hypothetical protein